MTLMPQFKNVIIITECILSLKLIIPQQFASDP